MSYQIQMRDELGQWTWYGVGGSAADCTHETYDSAERALEILIETCPEFAECELRIAEVAS